MTKQKPKFRRSDGHKYSKLGVRRKKKQVYRKAKGRDNKIRLNMKGHVRSVRVGFRSAVKERDLIMGMKPVIIYNVEGLNKIEKGMIGIVGKIGAKKKMEIAKIASEKKIRLLNLDAEKFLKKIEERLKKAKEKRKKMNEKKRAKDKKTKQKIDKKTEEKIVEKAIDKVEGEKETIKEAKKEIAEKIEKEVEKVKDKKNMEERKWMRI